MFGLQSLFTKYKKEEGYGFSKATENSLNQEGFILQELQIKYGTDNVKYHQPIFYKLKNSNRIFHKVPDFIVFENDYIHIFECKLNSGWSRDKEQLGDYFKLIQFMQQPQ
jgi:hypothetical protein